MTNVFSPNGFSPVRLINGAAWTGAMNKYLIIGSNTHSFFKGDPVFMLSTGYIDRDVYTNLPTQGVLGIFNGCSYYSNAAQRQVWSNTYPGSDVTSTSTITAYVIDDPNTVFRAWVGTGTSSAAGGPAVQGDVFENFQYALGTGNTTSGLSGSYIDYAQKGTTNTDPFQLIGLVTAPPGVNGTDVTTAGNMVEVIMNQQAFKVGTTGV